jgi:hypothetical protein
MICAAHPMMRVNIDVPAIISTPRRHVLQQMALGRRVREEDRRSASVVAVSYQP